MSDVDSDFIAKPYSIDDLMNDNDNIVLQDFKYEFDNLQLDTDEDGGPAQNVGINDNDFGMQGKIFVYSTQGTS